jgi:hypothetical protein
MRPMPTCAASSAAWRLGRTLDNPARLAYKLIGHRQFTREATAIRG